MVLKFVVDTLADILDLEEEEIKSESLIYEELDADSLDMSQVMLALEAKYSIEIEADDFMDFESVKDIVSYVESKLS